MLPLPLGDLLSEHDTLHVGGAEVDAAARFVIAKRRALSTMSRPRLVASAR